MTSRKVEHSHVLRPPWQAKETGCVRSRGNADRAPRRWTERRRSRGCWFDAQSVGNRGCTSSASTNPTMVGIFISNNQPAGDFTGNFAVAFSVTVSIPGGASVVRPIGVRLRCQRKLLALEGRWLTGATSAARIEQRCAAASGREWSNQQSQLGSTRSRFSRTITTGWRPSKRSGLTPWIEFHKRRNPSKLIALPRSTPNSTFAFSAARFSCSAESAARSLAGGGCACGAAHRVKLRQR